MRHISSAGIHRCELTSVVCKQVMQVWGSCYVCRLPVTVWGWVTPLLKPYLQQPSIPLVVTITGQQTRSSWCIRQHLYKWLLQLPRVMGQTHRSI